MKLSNTFLPLEKDDTFSKQTYEMTTISNPQIDLAFEYISQTNKNIFLTGKAGTGKTTFLHRVRQEVSKRMAVVAPTGVAAINAKGVTIHSLFQLSFGPLVPGHSKDKAKQRRFSKKKIQLLKSLDLLIIDEISMVRADVLDAIDEVLQRYRRSSQAFGGLQLLMIGDLHQLPPVVKQQEWDLLRMHYQTPYFFGSLALQKTDAVTIELKHIYRQADSQFIQLLNKVRDNQITASSLEALNSRYRDDFKPSDDEGYITLTSHNASAQAINRKKLQGTPGAISPFKASIDGDFPAHAYPTEIDLAFKVNAQVMFVKNDPSPEKQYYNGKIGRITKIQGDDIVVHCPEDEESITVGPVEWHNLKYTLDEESKEVKEEVIGTFTQYPLKLAWAITIHKSQGLTFDKVIIDAQAAFAHGQVYVALSRCKTFEGIVLRSRLIPTSVRTDRVVRTYTDQAQQNEPGEEELKAAKRDYQEELIRRFFRFKSVQRSFNLLYRIVLENEPSLQGSIADELKTLKENAEEKIVRIGEKFNRQLGTYFSPQLLPTENEALMDRLRKAGAYFTQQIKEEFLPGVGDLQVLTDNKAVGKKVKERLGELKKELFIQQATAQIYSTAFDPRTITRVAADAELNFDATQAPTRKRRAAPKDITHPALYELLTQWRAATATEDDVERYTVLPTRTLIEIVAVLPSTIANLKKINGIGKVRANQYGQPILDIVSAYCQEHGLEPDQLQMATGKAPKTPKPPKPDTKLTSLSLFKQGKSIPEIAEERGFVVSTIQGHFAHFIGKGELAIHEVFESEKIAPLLAYFKSNTTGVLTDVKQHFGEKYSYGELKMALAHWKWQRDQEEK